MTTTTRQHKKGHCEVETTLILRIRALGANVFAENVAASQRQRQKWFAAAASLAMQQRQSASFEVDLNGSRQCR